MASTRKPPFVVLGALIAVLVAGCASTKAKWGKIPYGTDRAEVLKTLGEPDLVSKDKTGRDAIFWEIDSFEGCGVIFDSAGKVADKECIEDAEGRARHQAAQAEIYRRMAQSMDESRRYQQQNMQNFQQSLQNSRPRQTNCTSNGMGNSVYTNCTSY